MTVETLKNEREIERDAIDLVLSGSSYLLRTD